jgi:hypothetical protein
LEVRGWGGQGAKGVRCGGRKGREANCVGESQGPAVFKEEAGLGVRGWVCCLNEWAAASLYTSPNPNHAPETTRQMRTPRPPSAAPPCIAMSLHPRRSTQALSRTMHHYIIREHFSGGGGEALDGGHSLLLGWGSDPMLVGSHVQRHHPTDGHLAVV